MGQQEDVLCIIKILRQLNTLEDKKDCNLLLFLVFAWFNTQFNYVAKINK